MKVVVSFVKMLYFLVLDVIILQVAVLESYAELQTRTYWKEKMMDYPYACTYSIWIFKHKFYLHVKKYT